jgi:hypothetical protein
MRSLQHVLRPVTSLEAISGNWKRGIDVVGRVQLDGLNSGRYDKLQRLIIEAK